MGRFSRLATARAPLAHDSAEVASRSCGDVPVRSIVAILPPAQALGRSCKAHPTAREANATSPRAPARAWGVPRSRVEAVRWARLANRSATLARPRFHHLPTTSKGQAGSPARWPSYASRLPSCATDVPGTREGSLRRRSHRPRWATRVHPSRDDRPASREGMPSKREGAPSWCSRWRDSPTRMDVTTCASLRSQGALPASRWCAPVAGTCAPISGTCAPSEGAIVRSSANRCMSRGAGDRREPRQKRGSASKAA